MQTITDIVKNHTLGYVLTAVVTALATTLIVEYFAKPKLEARKERIIRDRNQIDEVIFLIQELALSLSTLQIKKMADHKELDIYLERQCTHATLVTEKLQGIVPRLQLKYVLKNKKHLAFSMAYLGELRAKLYLLKSALENKKASPITDSINKLTDLLKDMELMDYTFELSRHNRVYKIVNGNEAKKKSLKLKSNLEKMGHSL